MARFSSVALIAFLASQCGASDKSSKSSLRSSVTFENASRKLSWEAIAGYEPKSSVTDHNAIDLDQAAMESEIGKKTSEGFENGKAIYEQGGHSKSYASLTLKKALRGDVVKGTAITGKDSAGNDVTGKAYSDIPSGSKILKVQYSTTDIQDSYVGCQVGGLSKAGVQNTENCFAAKGTVVIGRMKMPYTYDPLEDNNNGRTLQGFSLQVQKKMLDCENCPYKDAEYFVKYYGRPDYGNEWVSAAFDGRQTRMSKGGADFSKYGFTGKVEAIKKGTAYLNVFMYVIREFEDALDDCQSGCIGCNDSPVHAWDEGVAFYTGSLEGEDGLSSGKLLHALADKRCANFKVCGVNGDETSGTSKVNLDLFELFKQGQNDLLTGNCAAAGETKNKIADLMYIPMIQGTLRYAYKVGVLSEGEKAMAEGAVFAAAVLPRIHAADAQAARTIYDNMRVGAKSTSASDVKEAFESVYVDLNIDCDQVGGLWSSDKDDYYKGAKPCRSRN